MPAPEKRRRSSFQSPSIARTPGTSRQIAPSSAAPVARPRHRATVARLDGGEDRADRPGDRAIEVRHGRRERHDQAHELRQEDDRQEDDRRHHQRERQAGQDHGERRDRRQAPALSPVPGLLVEEAGAIGRPFDVLPRSRARGAPGVRTGGGRFRRRRWRDRPHWQGWRGSLRSRVGRRLVARRRMLNGPLPHPPALGEPRPQRALPGHATLYWRGALGGLLPTLEVVHRALVEARLGGLLLVVLVIALGIRRRSGRVRRSRRRGSIVKGRGVGASSSITERPVLWFGAAAAQRTGLQRRVDALGASPD